MSTPDTERTPPCICTSCGHEQHSMMKPCEKCRSRKIISSHFMEQQHGEGWRELLRDKSETVN